MISFLHGTLVEVGLRQVVLDVNGVGFEIWMPTSDLVHMHRGDEARIHTVLVPGDDAFVLYGFADQPLRGLFNLLRGVNGVGPKTALAVLSALSPNDVRAAVADDDPKPFQRVSGIGPKTAKLMVLQLTGKVEPPAEMHQRHSSAGADTETVVTALVGLGWGEDDARAAVSSLDATEQRTDQLLKHALVLLGAQR